MQVGALIFNCAAQKIVDIQCHRLRTPDEALQPKLAFRVGQGKTDEKGRCGVVTGRRASREGGGRLN
jgi:hypothetical protein